jgi:hypothetical protein
MTNAVWLAVLLAVTSMPTPFSPVRQMSQPNSPLSSSMLQLDPFSESAILTSISYSRGFAKGETTGLPPFTC